MAEQCHQQLICGHIQSLEEKITLCKEKISLPLMARMIANCSILIGGYGNLQHCRSLRHIWSLVEEATSLRRTVQRGKDPDFDMVLLYFDWAFSFYLCLGTLVDTFKRQIYQPLLEKYQEQRGLGKAKVDRLTLSSRRSQLSPFSSDSGFSATSSGQLVTDMDTNMTSVPSGYDITQQRPCAAIGQLYGEYEELKELYDFKEIEQTLERIQSLLSSLDILLSSGDIDEDLFSPDSFATISHFMIKQPVLNVLRLFPDVLIKLEKAAWLANKWVRLNESKTNSVMEKLEKLTKVERALSTRVNKVKTEVNVMEERLEKQVLELNSYLVREQKAGEMKIALYELDTKIALLKTELGNVRHEKKQIKHYIFLASRKNQSASLKQLENHYRRNQLQRYSLAVRISSLSYQRAIMQDDLKTELNLNPSYVAFTNSSQEICDELETSLNAKCREETLLQRALVFIREDQQSLLSNMKAKP
ncbi:uncharacterized protein LOC135478291 [Liolophura sinensis]|uniref:uncharacterized protein LOC135478291 n=1 Tax=Liolophura sinensis TaxID=3198878 RepID=UPI003158F562